jgi:Tfp pilus assembly protein PilF
MTDALIADLAKISALRVISRTSVMQYKKARKTMPQIADELNVDAVVEGSVIMEGDQVRITVQLIHAPSDKHLWAESYERNLSSLLGLQKDLARVIAQEINVKLSPMEEEQLASVKEIAPEAYQLYLKGRYYLNNLTEDGFKRGLDILLDVIEMEPAYALAYADAALAYCSLAAWGYLPPNEARLKAKAAAISALELDENLGEAHVALAAVKQSYDWDWAGAESEFKRAIELSPNYARARAWYGFFLAALGRFSEADVQLAAAEELDPLALIHKTTRAYVQYVACDYDRAVEMCREVVGMDPSFFDARLTLGTSYVQKEAYEQGIGELESAAALSGNAPEVLAYLGHAYGVAGMTDQGEGILNQLGARAGKTYTAPCLLALVCVGLGQSDAAFEHFDQALAVRDGYLSYLLWDPAFDRTRSDPRFGKLIKTMGLER